MFGLKEAEVATLVRAIAGPDLQRDAIREQFARATWTGIAEPGDAMAGLVIESLGAAEALDAVVARWPSPRWLAALHQVGVDEVLEADLAAAMARWQPRLRSATALLALQQAGRCAARLLTPSSSEWPSGLSDLEFHAPTALWIRGGGAALASLHTSIALVGARAATGYGEHVTVELAAGLVDRGYTIVSGAAYGIDGVAHRTALASRGQTVAFLAGGVDRFYPSGHEALLTRIIEEGAVISELPCGAPPTRWRFLQRNRLIAAASRATIVVEAGWRSGSLNTAAHAAQIGRPLGAVPGPVTSSASTGCHRLIREYNAVLVTTAEQVAELAPLETSGTAVTSADRPLTIETEPSPTQIRILDALSARSPRTSSDVAERAGLSVADVRAVLGPLSLDGLVVERERGWVKVVPKDDSTTWGGRVQ